MIVYKVKNNKLIERRNESNDYVLQDGEFGFAQEVINYTISNGVMTDTTTQADRDVLAELQQENQFLQETIDQLRNADSLAKEIFSFVRKHTGLTDNQKSTLKSLAMKLFSGDVEEALVEWGAITRPVNEGKMQKVYDYLNPKFQSL